MKVFNYQCETPVNTVNVRELPWQQHLRQISCSQRAEKAEAQAHDLIIREMEFQRRLKSRGNSAMPRLGP